MSPKELADQAIREGLIRTESKRPEVTMNARLYGDDRFRRPRKGFWILRARRKN